MGLEKRIRRRRVLIEHIHASGYVNGLFGKGAALSGTRLV